MAFTTLTLAPAGITLSNGGLTATIGTTSGNSQNAGSTDYQATGKFYFEVTATQLSSNFDGVGLANNQSALTGTANSKNGVVWFKGAGMQNDGLVSSAAPPAFVNGNLICIAVDVGARLFWGRVGAAGNWNGNANANPATGVGGLAYDHPGEVAPIVSIGATVGDNATVNFGASAFTGTVPSGFTSGWTTSTATRGVVSQVGAEAFVNNPSAAFVTQTGAEAFVSNPSAAFVTQTGIEAWVSTANASNLALASQIAAQRQIRGSALPVVPLAARVKGQAAQRSALADVLALSARVNAQGRMQPGLFDILALSALVNGQRQVRAGAGDVLALSAQVRGAAAVRPRLAAASSVTPNVFVVT